MEKVAKSLRNFVMKHFGGYELDDPRPTQEKAPYTFFLPNTDRLQAVEVGDEVKLIIRAIRGRYRYDAERMWVTVTEISDENMIGTLSNFPLDMPQLTLGDTIQFKRYHIIDYQWQNPNKEAGFLPQESKQRWERCLVDACVLNSGVPVTYLYREEPDMGSEDDKYPDSGWRIRGDEDLMSREEFENGKPEYVALGAVLNKDDTWLHLIDEPTGSYFFKNP